MLAQEKETTKLSETMKYHLLDTVRWTKFLAILGFIGLSLMSIFLVIIMASGGAMMAISPQFTTANMLSFIIGMAVILVINWYPVLMLYRFSVSIKEGIQTENSQLLENAFRYQKNMYRFMAILTIIGILFYVLVFSIALYTRL